MPRATAAARRARGPCCAARSKDLGLANTRGSAARMKRPSAPHLRLRRRICRAASAEAAGAWRERAWSGCDACGSGAGLGCGRGCGRGCGHGCDCGCGSGCASGCGPCASCPCAAPCRRPRHPASCPPPGRPALFPAGRARPVCPPWRTCAGRAPRRGRGRSGEICVPRGTMPLGTHAAPLSERDASRGAARNSRRGPRFARGAVVAALHRSPRRLCAACARCARPPLRDGHRRGRAVL